LLLVLALAAPTLARDDEPKDKDKPADKKDEAKDKKDKDKKEEPKDKDAVTDVIAALRKAPVADALPGVLIDGKATKNFEGQLRLAGFVDNAAQRAAVEKETTNLLKKNADWAKEFPRGVTAAGMKELPLRAILQKDFATGTRDDEQARDILQQTRVVDVRSGEDTVLCRVVCIYGQPGEDAPDIKSIVANAVQAMIHTDPALKDLRALDWKTKGEEAHQVVLPERPVPVLQYRSSLDAALDGTWIQRAAYDAEGKLVIQGRVPSDGARSKVESFLKDEEKDNRKHWFSSAATGAGPQWSTSGVKTVEWTLQKDLNARLAAADLASVLTKVMAADLKQVRVDRAYFTYSGMSPDERDAPIRFELRLTGFSFADFEKPERNDELRTWIQAALKKTADMPKVDSTRVNIRTVSEPRFDLQPLVAVDKKLDGVRIDDGTRFTPDGRVLLTGVWRGKEQEEELRKLVDGYLAITNSPGLRGTKAAFDNFKVVPTDKILLTLRQRSGRQLEDVWIDRLYYDKNGKLCLTGFYPEKADEDKAKVEGWLKDLLKDLGLTEKTTLLGPRRPVELASRVLSRAALADPLDGVRLDLEGRRSLAAHLRGIVQYPAGRGADTSKYQTKWDGILLRRGFYTPDGQYVLDVLIDSKRQRDDFVALVRGLEKDEEWQLQLVRGWRDDFTLMPIAPMITRLQVVMPNFPVLDGITLVGAVHDTDKRLLLRADIVGPTPARPARDRIRDMLRNSRQWSGRVESGVLFRTVTQQERIPELAESMKYKALSCMRLCDVNTSKEYASTAILHDPGDSTAWFVRGLGYFMRGDMEQSVRDLRRVAMREGPDQPDGGFQRVQRIRQLEMIQGGHRRQSEVIIKQQRLELLSGRQPVIRME
jgi:hypothetical protein